MGPLPVVFVSHGAPVSLEDRDWMECLGRWGASLLEVEAILAVSAHWVTPALMMGPLGQMRLIYDFGGFPERFYRMTYNALTAPDLADTLASLPGIGEIITNPSRGLDHGMWVPLKGMFPQGNVPVLGLSLPGLSPRKLYELGRMLAPLRRRGVLLLASGGITHNLSELSPDPETSPDSWAIEFDQWIVDALEERKIEKILDYVAQAPHAHRSHPTPEHIAPLFVAMGAAEGYARVTSPVTGFRWGTLSLRSFQFCV